MVEAVAVELVEELKNAGDFGGFTAVELLTSTLSNVLVFSTLVLFDVTARPTKIVVPIVIVALPTCVHVVPSGERYAVIVVPLRISFTQ